MSSNEAVGRHIGQIVIDYAINPEGEPITAVNVLGDIPLVVPLGLLKLAEDSLMYPPPPMGIQEDGYVDEE